MKEFSYQKLQVIGVQVMRDHAPDHVVATSVAVQLIATKCAMALIIHSSLLLITKRKANIFPKSELVQAPCVLLSIHLGGVMTLKKRQKVLLI